MRGGRGSATTRRCGCSTAVGIPDPEAADAGLPARALRRPAPARDDRDRDRRQSRADHRRRADDRARRHRAGAGAALLAACATSSAARSCSSPTTSASPRRSPTASRCCTRGRIAEIGARRATLLGSPAHPYTDGSAAHASTRCRPRGPAASDARAASPPTRAAAARLPVSSPGAALRAAAAAPRRCRRCVTDRKPLRCLRSGATRSPRSSGAERRPGPWPVSPRQVAARACHRRRDSSSTLGSGSVPPGAGVRILAVSI